MSSKFKTSRRIGRIITLLGAVFLLFIASATVPLVTGKGLSFSVPSSPAETNTAGTLYINTSFTVENHCLYAIRQIYYTLNLSVLTNGTLIYSYSTHLAAALPGQIERYSISVPVTIGALPAWFVSEAATTPVNMSVGTSISASYAYGFFQFGVSYKGPFTSSSIVKPAQLANSQEAQRYADYPQIPQSATYTGAAA
ncbi:MAG: hypothetical protein KIS30_02070 [Thermoplasmata archaeon]|nr:hypothetical protein [Candidatus Sysuiplasma acidicola]MBX8645532.1 hypothetical protein [Candidatus Sysuiplasma acidicola]MDH2904932.1 hypothetical protein [Methanomassiliicoccales archaeon]